MLHNFVYNVCGCTGDWKMDSFEMCIRDRSITTAGKQKLVIDRKELDKMSGKRVLVVDDVISTGCLLYTSIRS